MRRGAAPRRACLLCLCLRLYPRLCLRQVPMRPSLRLHLCLWFALNRPHEEVSPYFCMICVRLLCRHVLG